MKCVMLRECFLWPKIIAKTYNSIQNIELRISNHKAPKAGPIPEYHSIIFRVKLRAKTHIKTFVSPHITQSKDTNFSRKNEVKK